MQNVYMFEHKIVVEVDRETGEPIHSTCLLGFFSSEEKCKEMIPHYLEQSGFKENPNDFVIQKIEADTDAFNEVEGVFKETVFYLSHEWYDGEYDHISDLGYYSTQEKADIALEKFKKHDDFIEHLDGFCIAGHEIDKAEWLEGFISWEEMNRYREEMGLD